MLEHRQLALLRTELLREISVYSRDADAGKSNDERNGGLNVGRAKEPRLVQLPYFKLCFALFSSAFLNGCLELFHFKAFFFIFRRLRRGCGGCNLLFHVSPGSKSRNTAASRA